MGCPQSRGNELWIIYPAQWSLVIFSKFLKNKEENQGGIGWNYEYQHNKLFFYFLLKFNNISVVFQLISYKVNVYYLNKQ